MQRYMLYAFILLGVMFLLGILSRSEHGEKTLPVVSLEKLNPKPKIAPTKRVKKALSETELNRLLSMSPWPKELHPAVKRVAFCESSWIPDAIGPTDDHGLMQIRIKNHTKKVGAEANLYDPLVNLHIAFAIFNEARRGKFKNGFAPWLMSNKCHGLVPHGVAANIKKFKEEKAKHEKVF